MDYKNELVKLVEIVKVAAKNSGQKLSRKDFAERMGFKNETYWSQLLGEGGKVKEDHIFKFKEKFRSELQAAGIPLAGDPLNEERAMILALLADYIEQAAIREKVDSDVVEARLKKKASLILKGLNARR